MQIRLTVLILLLLCPFLLLDQANANPQISTVNGVFSQGASIVASGQSFGAKSPAAPLRYDNFENGVIGSPLDPDLWSLMPDSDNSFLAKHSRDRARVPGETVAIQDYSQGYNATIGLWGMDCSKIYFSGWCYRDDYAGTALNTTNRKLSGNFGKSVSGSYGFPQARVGTDGANNYGEHHYVTSDGSSDLHGDYYQPSADLWDRWFRLERYMDIGTPNGNNGRTWIAHDLTHDSEFSGTMYTEGSPYDYFIIGQYFRRDNGALLKMYWGELYVDNTLARIEIGNAATFEQCTHREIQIPTGWSDGSVSFTANLGTFDGTQNTYLYVINSLGEPSNGIPVTINPVTPPPTGPGMPGQPQVVR